MLSDTIVKIRPELLDTSHVMLPEKITKRDGRVVEFKSGLITRAIEKCFAGINRTPHVSIDELTYRVLNAISARNVTNVEDIQDLAEITLMSAGEFEAAKAYVLYRAEHARLRSIRPISTDVQAAFDESAKYFPTPLQMFQFMDKYSRFDTEKGRRETWPETVDRTVQFLTELVETNVSPIVATTMQLDGTFNRIRDFILTMKSMPSMRLLAMAGPAARRDNATCYNCSFCPIDSIDSFVEALLLSMAGVGVGFSVERRHVSKLPKIGIQNKDAAIPLLYVEDTSEGWGKAVYKGLYAWFNGQDINFKFDLIRPAGTPLKTKGGRACLTGDTVIYRDKKKWGTDKNCQTIESLYNMWQAGKGRSREVTVRCLNEETGQFYRNRVVNVVHNGLAPVYKVELENGYSIKATDNHRFMRLDGRYDYLENLSVGEVLAVNGADVALSRCVDCGTAISIRATRCNQCKEYRNRCMDCGKAITRKSTRCKLCVDKLQIKPDALGTTARMRKECQGAKLDHCEQCNANKSEIISELHVHHIDRNPLNNDLSNLLTLCEPCHHKTHARENNEGRPHRQKFLTYAKIENIEFIGIEDVYDLQMAAPNHNFVANGFVSHNSGPLPLQKALAFARERILARQGSYLRSLDAHDIVCSIGSAAISGGVRRMAMLSLFDADDKEMYECKVGDFETHNQQRWNANNSAVIPEEGISQSQFLDLWTAMIKSECGEPGFISRQAIQNTLPARRKYDVNMGVNPCAEIFLRPMEFCNLSICVARKDDTLQTLLEKVEVATIIGTIQSLATYFPGLRPEWKKNAEEERLLGVDITGQRDCRILEDPLVMQTLRENALTTNQIWASRFNINQSTAVTCVKPSGNSSVLLDCSSGLHPRWAKHYIRRVRVAATSSIASVLKDSGVPLIPEVGQDPVNPFTWVVEFPVKAPEGTRVRSDLSALDQFEYWLHNKLNWTEHNPSVTVQYKPNEIIPLMTKVWDNIEVLGGMSFLPYSDVNLDLLPYQEISKEEYERRAREFPKIDFAKITRFEYLDETTVAQELSCVANNCEV